MLALVDGVPRTLRLDQFIRHWVTHQIEVIVRRTRYLLRKAEERAHILRALLKAIDQIDAVIALIRASDVGRGRPAGPDGPAGHRRDPGPGHPRHAAAQAGRAGAPAAHRRVRGADGPDRRLRGDPGLAGAAAGDRQQRAGRDRRQVRRRPADRDHRLRRRHVDRGPDRRGGRGRHDHPRRLRQADQDRPVPGAAARRQGRARRAAAARRHRRPLLRHHDPPLDPVLHQQGPGLPGQGLRAARRRPRRPRPARGQPAGLPAGRADRPGAGAARLRGRAVPGAGHLGAGWSRSRG